MFSANSQAAFSSKRVSNFEWSTSNRSTDQSDCVHCRSSPRSAFKATRKRRICIKNACASFAPQTRKTVRALRAPFSSRQLDKHSRSNCLQNVCSNDRRLPLKRLPSVCHSEKFAVKKFAIQKFANQKFVIKKFIPFKRLSLKS